MGRYPDASRCQLGSVEANRREGLRRISVLDLGAQGAELKGSEDSGRHKPDQKTHPINHVANLIIPAMATSHCHASPNPRPAPKPAPTFISKVVPPGINEGSGPIHTCDQPSPREPAQQNNGEQLRAKGHAADRMSLMSGITLAEGASLLLYSSRPGITAKLLLSIGAAGRPISPIWSKNPGEDQHYVRLKPHD